MNNYKQFVMQVLVNAYKKSTPLASRLALAYSPETKTHRSPGTSSSFSVLARWQEALL